MTMVNINPEALEMAEEALAEIKERTGANITLEALVSQAVIDFIECPLGGLEVDKDDLQEGDEVIDKNNRTLDVLWDSDNNSIYFRDMNGIIVDDEDVLSELHYIRSDKKGIEFVLAVQVDDDDRE